MAAAHRLLAGAGLHVDDAGGQGLPVIFQHGLCGDARQTREAFPQNPSWRRITVEMPGHGASEPGDPAAYSIATFGSELAAFLDEHKFGPVVVGGISMGAAIALRLAVMRPDLVRGLILARPAWVTEAAPGNIRPNAEVGNLLASRSQADARALFLAGKTAARLAAQAPDNLASLTTFFDRQPQAVTAALLTRIAADGPGVTEAQVRAITVPMLIIGHDRDAIHPLGHAKSLHALAPHAGLVEITPKATDKARYISDFHAAISGFLKGFSK